MEFDKKDVPKSTDSLMKVDQSNTFEKVRSFKTDSHLVPRECRETLSSVARLMLTGVKLADEEVNKHLLKGLIELFKFDIPGLRQIVHWTIKELLNCPNLNVGDYRSTFPNKVANDASGRKESNRILKPNAIRTLCRVFDVSDAQTFAKVIDPSIVDPDSSVQSAALVSLYHSLPWGVSHLRPLQKQIQAASAQDRSSGTWAWPEYHALGLDYHTRLAREMLAKDYIRSGDGGSKRTKKVHGPPAKIFFARFAAELAEKGNYRAGAIEFLKELLESFESIEYDPTITGDKESFVLKRSMVALEAAKTICKMEEVDPTTLDAAVQKLVDMANNSHQVVKFSAMRTLCSVASIYPNIVRKYNDSIRKQMKNSNKDIGSFATTTLLKTADEADVDSLMKDVGSLMTTASNDFKVIIVEAVTALCLKFTNKKAALAKFLGDYLKDEGSYEFKRAMVEGMFDLVKSIPETREEVLLQLCEFIEDCEYPGLTIRVLHVVGSEGPTVKNPTIYIRYIYNRLVLENALVRAAAVTALSKFGVGQKDPELKRSVHVLLSRSLGDDDDEVRDRAALSLRLMDDEDESAPELIRNDSMFSLAEFEDRLAMYVSAEDRETFKEPFDLSIVPLVSREKARSETRTKKLLGNTSVPKTRAPESKPSVQRGADALASSAAATSTYMKEMQSYPDLAACGNLLKSSPVIELTEPTTEYVVTAVKHIFREHIVVQYNITNTLDDCALVDVTVEVMPQNGSDLEDGYVYSVPELRTQQSGAVYVRFKKANGAEDFVSDNLTNVLRFTVKEVDPKTDEMQEDGYQDEYPVEDLTLNVADFVIPAYAGSFDHVWGQSYADEDTQTLQLSLTKIQDAVDQIPAALSLQPLDGTDIAASKSRHELKLFGKTVFGGKVAADVNIVRLSEGEFAIKISAKSEEQGVAKLLANCLM
ncbi:adaptin N terminal region-domain-containing protein [Phyllosticta capitalensis]|uniref:Coatomer subunit gamma n=1 Tax=Phyllosticta capitalensis TaxID=121624 RepID=A0ABR1YHK8_9PEZI